MKWEEPPHLAGGQSGGSGLDLSSAFVRAGISVCFHQLWASLTLQICSGAAVSLRGWENKPAPLYAGKWAVLCERVPVG